jgi:hypothetical protein
MPLSVIVTSAPFSSDGVAACSAASSAAFTRVGLMSLSRSVTDHAVSSAGMNTSSDVHAA